MVLPPTSTIPTFRLRLLNGGLAITIGLLLFRIQGSPDAFTTKNSVEPYNSHARVTQEDQQLRQLKQGKPIERDLAGGQSHTFEITLATDQYIKVLVDQHGIDLRVKLLGPDGKQIAEFDSERRKEGEETASWITEQEGSYRLEIKAKYSNATGGRYRIRVVELGVATDGDRALHEAMKLNTEFLGLYRGGKYDEARPLGERVLEIREKTLGPDHPDVALAVNNLANLFNLKGDFERSEEGYQRALKIREKALGPEHPDVASTLNNLAYLYNEKGDYAKAEQLYQRAVAIVEKALGAEHPDVAAVLTSFGKLYYERCEWEKAELLFQRALTTWEKALGAVHPNVTIALNNLAAVYKATNDYGRAEPLLQRALTIDMKVWGPEHPEAASSLINLANIYYERGDYEKAEPLYGRAVAIREKALGREHPDLARPIENLADLYKDRREYAKAEPLYLRALAIREKALGNEHPFVALTLDNLASFYSERGEYARAEPLYQRALAIGEGAVGPEHPGVAQALNNLANLYRARGEFATAEPLFARALSIREKVLGQKHEKFAESLADIARLHSAKGEYAQAISALSRSNSVEERNFVRTIGIGSDRQKLLYLSKFTEKIDFTLSLQSQAAPDDSQALQLALATLLCRKGRGLDAMADTIARLRQNASPEVQALFERVITARSRLATLKLNGPDAVKPDTYLTRVKNLEVEVDELEGKLSALNSEFRNQVQPITLAAVQAALPAEASLVEFAYFTPSDPKTGKSREPHYIAYVLASKGEPKWVDIGEAAQIDQAMEAWRNALRDSSRTDVKRLARAVDEKLMRPVRSIISEMPNTRHLLISPDGALNLIPFAALVDEQNQYLIERYSFSYLTSGRDLLRLQSPEPSKDAPLVVANPDFGSFTAIALRRGRGKTRGSKRSKSPDEPSQFFFQPLPSTEDEALAIKALLPSASVLQGEDATETALKRTRGPKILHIATHGFFINKQEPRSAGNNPTNAGTSGSIAAADESYTVQLEATPALETAQEAVERLRSHGVDGYILKKRASGRRIFFRVRSGNFPTQADAQKYGADLQERGLAREYFVAPYTAPDTRLRIGMSLARVKDPLLRSGLALAGANYEKRGDDDGVLTALEAAYLYLSGTKLVVLSACDTGVGDVKNGEGVQGLRRALVLAGSESQVMSLWPVSDEVTKDLMIPYYKGLTNGEGRSEGLRQVQLKMLRGPKEHQHPFYWAAFIHSGEWANLDGRRQ
jgi:CHAT domain-containing protein/Tfp pilus assembly protein PilF